MSAAYIKNRTHYEEPLLEPVVTLTATYHNYTTLKFDIDAQTIYSMSGSSGYPSIDCVTYAGIVKTARAEFVETTSTAWTHLYIDDVQVVNGLGFAGEETVYLKGEGFVEGQTYDVQFCKATGDTTVHQLDEKFIPDSIARISDIPEVTNADWDVNDETSPAYIANKPFGEEINVETVLAETTYTSTSGYEACGTFDGEFELGITYTVTHNGTVFEVQPEKTTELGSQYVYFAEEPGPNGETFYINNGSIYLIPAGEHTFKIEKVDKSIKMIDEKFLPMQDVSWNALLNKPFYEIHIDDGNNEYNEKAYFKRHDRIFTIDDIIGSKIYWADETNFPPVDYLYEITEDNITEYEWGFDFTYGYVIATAPATINDVIYNETGLYLLTQYCGLTDGVSSEIYKTPYMDIYIKLDEKFLPDTVAKTTDISTSLESTLEEAKTYTDEQINAAKIVATITMKFVPGTGFVTTCDTSFANMWAANEEGKTVLIKYNNYLTHANMITEDSGEKQIFVVIPDAYGNTNYFTIKEDESVIFDSANFIANNELKQTTGTDTASSISVMSQKAVTDALALKSDTNHTHTIEDVENLQTTLDEISEKASESATFIVNITENEDDEGNFTYSADKTFDEIVEAHESGKVVKAMNSDVFMNITIIDDTAVLFRHNFAAGLAQEIMECYIYNDNTIEFFNELLSIEEAMGSNSLSTTNKTIVGAINELNELKVDKNDLIGASYNELGEIFNDYANNIASGVLSHAEGASTTALGNNSHAEGENTVASGYNSHAEGESTTALAKDSHAEGYLTGASGYCSHAEGLSYNKYPNTIKASSSKDEVITAWDKTKFSLAHGEASHVEGVNTLAAGMFSHAEGECTIATTKASHVQGKYNTKDTENKYAHIVGNGESYNIRSNAHTLDWNGNA